ncbi:hypothetical protein [Pseudolysinimonas yzui]|uniref:Uncharacterized protein n=1 Tax=Pseudolysinimonas yzui TaxID=2708254 RepID=A0A8J3M2C4_9MICO|nr:hypothetical protein [Pseudolysinimonas yzui]GHF22668.1 hypothetical protein GCM10011600_24760 [Pseudolysinimonas yzui]
MRFVQAGVMLLGAVIYVLVIKFLGELSRADALWVVPAAFIGWNILVFVTFILVAIDGVRKVRAGKTRQLATDLFVVKLSAIPFFLINFALLAVITAAGTVMLRAAGIVFLAFVPLEVALTYLAMVSTSVYGWASIVQLRRDRVIGTGLTVLYSFLLLIFVTDIVAGILLFGHSRRRPGVTLVVVLLVFGAVLTVLGFFTPLLNSIPGIEWVGLAGVVVILVTIVVGLTRSWRLRRRAADIVPPADEAAVEAASGSAGGKP